MYLHLGESATHVELCKRKFGAKAYQEFLEYILLYVQQQYRNNPNIWRDCQTYLTLRHFQELEKLNDKHPKMVNKKRTTIYKLAWASHLSKEYGAPDLLIPKYADPLHPQFYNNHELMEAEEVLNEFLVFPGDPGNLSTHFCRINCRERKSKIRRNDHFESSEGKASHKIWKEKGLKNPLTEIGVRGEIPYNHPTISSSKEYTREYFYDIIKEGIRKNSNISSVCNMGQ